MQTEESRQQVLAKIKMAVDSGHHIVVIVSAMGRKGDPYATDTLLSLAPWEASSAELELVKCSGEFISASLLTALIKTNGISCNLLYGTNAGLVGDSLLHPSQMKHCEESVQTYSVTVVPGFHYVTKEAYFTTFERGGSDFTALLFAHYFQCEAIFFKDVEGAYFPPESSCVAKSLTHQQLCELEVIQQRAAQFAAKHKIPLTIQSYLTEGSGTLIRDLPQQAQ